MGHYFGTDGIRASAEAEILQPPFLKRLAKAAFAFAGGKSGLSIVIGRDPRTSGARIVDALSEVWVGAGGRVLDCGIVPTPAIALAVKAAKADLGVVVTASHNPARDNGIKFFSGSGTKLSEADEARLEALIDTVADLTPCEGGERQAHPAAKAYESFAIGQAAAGILQGKKIVLDCAHGATAKTTPVVLRALGAELILLGDAPDGKNINAGVGSEHPEVLAAKVLESGADLGIAHDGDGDRVLFVDAAGVVVPGDAILALIGQHMIREDLLKDKTLVATVMSNLGLDRSIEALGGRVLRTPVGDRQVFYKMLEGDFGFGGESSGHFILRSHLETGDGLTAALAFLKAWLASGAPVSELASSITLFPQKIVNLYVDEKKPFEAIPEFTEALGKIEKELGTEGRILVRYSGTENKVRLLAEAESEALAQSTIERLEKLVATHLVLTK
jgi:phosphoglucosamine mutase|tara:strand:+ start:88637 stop:89974 length:1338 start_codon:yes stop_codon:yes gene_type:complete